MVGLGRTDAAAARAVLTASHAGRALLAQDIDDYGGLDDRGDHLLQLQRSP